MGAPRHILILTAGNLSRSPRPEKEAATLTRAGYRVTVLHPSERPHYDRLDAELAAAGGYENISLVFDRTPFTRNARRLRRWLAVRTVPLGFEDVAALGAGRELLARARAHPADLTIVHNELALWVGYRLLREGRRVAADIEDWHSEDLQVSERRHRPLRLLRRVEGAMLRGAAYVSTTSAALASALQQTYGGPRAAILTNSFPLQPDPRTAPTTGSAPAFFWFSQTIGPGRGLEAFLQTWAQLPVPSRVVLLGEPRPGFPDHLRSLLPPDRRPQLEFLGLVPPPALPGVIARHDIGLALEVSSIPNRDLTITNKILQYLNAGLALVATPTAGQREVLQAAPHAGVLLDPNAPDAALGTLTGWLRDPDQLRAVQRAARAAAESTYCWEREAPRLLALVENALTIR